jgi:hypothetical protein
MSWPVRSWRWFALEGFLLSRADCDGPACARSARRKAAGEFPGMKDRRCGLAREVQPTRRLFLRHGPRPTRKDSPHASVE